VLIVGAVFAASGAVATGEADQMKARATSGATLATDTAPRYLDLRDQAGWQAPLGTVGLLAGGALAVGGLILYFALPVPAAPAEGAPAWPQAALSAGP